MSRYAGARMGRIPAWLLALALTGFEILGSDVQAQNPPLPTARDTAYRRYLQAAARMQGGSIEPNWMADGRSFWYVTGGVDDAIIRKVDPAANRETVLFEPDRLRRALAPLLGQEPPHRGLPFRHVDVIGRDERAARFTVQGRRFEIELASYAIRELPSSAPDELNRRTAQRARRASLAMLPDVREVASPDGSRFAGLDGHNLQVRYARDGQVDLLTTDGTATHSWDVLGAQWSPDGRIVTATRVDTRGMPVRPVIDWLTVPETVAWVRLGRSGDAVPQTEMYLVDVDGRTRRRVATGSEPDQSLAVVRWRSDGSELLITRQERGHRRLDLLAVEPRSGAVRTILTETASTFVRPAASQFEAAAFTPLGDNRRFIWMSERTGWSNLYLYDYEGRLIRPLTPDSFPVTEVVAVDERAGWVYFAGHGDRERPYDAHLYRVDLAGRRVERLTDLPGTHHSPAYLALIGLPAGRVIFSPDRRYFLDMHSSLDRPPRVDLRRADGRLIRTVVQADTTGLGATGWTAPEQIVVKAADGVTDLHAVIYRPAGFDPRRKYPVIDYIYGGPQTTWVPRAFTDVRGLGAGALAQTGFIVVAVDGRGTPERGKAFQDVVYGNFGRHEIPDHVAALRQLFARYPELDSSRVGVMGSSFGGYMAVRAMLLAPELYKAGVATAPIADAFGSNLEMFMGLPPENPDGYAYASNLSLAARLQGALLLIHGTSDINAPFGETMRLADAFFRAGKVVETLVLPGETHAPTSRAGGAILSASRRFLERYLQP